MFNSRKGMLLGAVLVAATLLVGCSSASPATTADSTGTSSSISKQAVRFVQTVRTDATDIQTDVVAPEAGVRLLADDPSNVNQAAIDELATMAQQGHDDLANRKDAIAAATDGTGQIQTLEAEAYAGANDLKNALGALVAYTGNPNAATLAQFTSQFQTGQSEWNDAVTQLWQDAGATKPPTV